MLWISYFPPQKKSASICACTATLQNQSSSFPAKQCKTQNLRAAKHIEIISIAIITTTCQARICREWGGSRSSAPHQSQCRLLSPAHCWEHSHGIHPLPHIHPLAPWLHPVPFCPVCWCSPWQRSVSSKTGIRIPSLPMLRSEALHPSVRRQESQGAASPGCWRAQAAPCKPGSSFLILTRCNHLRLRCLCLQC